MRRGVLRVGRPAAEADHEALSDQLTRSASAQPPARQLPIHWRDDDRFLQKQGHTVQWNTLISPISLSIPQVRSRPRGSRWSIGVTITASWEHTHQRSTSHIVLRRSSSARRVRSRARGSRRSIGVACNGSRSVNMKHTCGVDSNSMACPSVQPGTAQPPLT